MTTQIGAGRHERSGCSVEPPQRGRPRTLSTPAGDVELRIPKVRVGSFFQSLLEPRRRVDKALFAVIMTVPALEPYPDALPGQAIRRRIQ